MTLTFSHRLSIAPRPGMGHGVGVHLPIYALADPILCNRKFVRAIAVSFQCSPPHPPAPTFFLPPPWR